MLLAIQKNQLNHQAHQNLQQGKKIYSFLSIPIFNWDWDSCIQLKRLARLIVTSQQI